VALPSEAPETTDFSNLPRDLGNSACIDMQGLSAPNPKQLAATAQREVSERTIDCVENASSVETTKIILEQLNRRGRSSASLPDGTVLVRSSRQAFLDAARVLVAAGHDPDSWLEGRRPGATAFALRARLGIAAGLTVDETRTVFAPWKPFSLSAVAPSIRRSEEAAPHPSCRPLGAPAAPARKAIRNNFADCGSWRSWPNRTLNEDRSRLNDGSRRPALSVRRRLPEKRKPSGKTRGLNFDKDVCDAWTATRTYDHGG
jgi:hypothetical protein